MLESVFMGRFLHLRGFYPRTRPIYASLPGNQLPFRAIGCAKFLVNLWRLLFIDNIIYLIVELY